MDKDTIIFTIKRLLKFINDEPVYDYLSKDDDINIQNSSKELKDFLEIIQKTHEHKVISHIRDSVRQLEKDIEWIIGQYRGQKFINDLIANKPPNMNMLPKNRLNNRLATFLMEQLDEHKFIELLDEWSGNAEQFKNDVIETKDHRRMDGFTQWLIYDKILPGQTQRLIEVYAKEAMITIPIDECIILDERLQDRPSIYEIVKISINKRTNKTRSVYFVKDLISNEGIKIRDRSTARSLRESAIFIGRTILIDPKESKYTLLDSVTEIPKKLWDSLSPYVNKLYEEYKKQNPKSSSIEFFRSNHAFIRNKMYKLAKQETPNSFNLPPDVTCTKKSIDGGVAHVFNHNKLGELGCIRIQDINGKTHLSCDMAGTFTDPLAEKRKAIFEPIAKDILKMFGGKPVEPIPPSPNEKKLVKSQIILCEHCESPVAMLIFAEKAYTPADLENYARMMYSEYKKMNVQTWVVGALMHSENDAPGYTLKVWPEREPAKLLTPSEFNMNLERLEKGHCNINKVSKEDVEPVILEIKNLHKKIHNNDPIPDNEIEQQAQNLLFTFQKTVIELLLNDINTDVIEKTLFFHWFSFIALNHGCTMEQVHNWISQMDNIIHPLISRLKQIASEIKDEGPSEDMAKLASKVQMLKDFINQTDIKLSTKEYAKQVEKVNRVWFDIGEDFIQQEFNPVLIQNAFFYHWLRISSIIANVDERLFQKLERNWPIVTAKIDKFFEEWMQSNMNEWK